MYREVKLFDLDDAPDHVRDAIRPIALAHVSTVDATAIWEITVGSYDWRDAAEEWALHRWLRENGATDGEIGAGETRLDGAARSDKAAIGTLATAIRSAPRPDALITACAGTTSVAAGGSLP